METRRYWADGNSESRSSHKRNGEEVSASLVWRCRTLWYQIRCGKPGVLEQLDGLPDFALVPLAAAGDANGQLREMECEMITLDSLNCDVPKGIGKLHIAACETSGGRSWFVSVEPETGLPRDIADACRRFGAFFTAALQLDKAFH
ncbi:MAG: hypothetical protein SFU56_15775 [Capsulimonadales bacterium]|nr:hypothetical protein [Capsulimonadales bacterium]